MIQKLKNVSSRMRAAFIAAVCLVLILAVYGYMNKSSIRSFLSSTMAHISAVPRERFPIVESANMSANDMRLLSIMKTEYDKKPVSFDENVLKYSDGEKQSWCADFVSWVFREAGSPLVNPNSGSWRIPGVYTLREYFESNGRYKNAGPYTPKFGDVAIYAKSPTNSHTNIVLEVNTRTKTMTVIGGNETGRVRILRNQSYLPGSRNLVGFGVDQNKE